MIEAIRANGARRAKAICDHCQRDEVVPCGYLPQSSGGGPNVGQVHKKMTSMGWAVRRGVLSCPACAARRRSHKEDPEMTDTVPKKAPVAPSPSQEPPREPDLGMLLEICGMLDVAYDRDHSGYSDPSDSDRTIAEAIGKGCMWGWVAQVREARYGPDLRQAEIVAIKAELKAARAARGDLVKRIEALQARLDALDPVPGQKAGRK